LDECVRATDLFRKGPAIQGIRIRPAPFPLIRSVPARTS
jgi:hypothetical protein